MSKYYVGDKLRIRQWDDMASEYEVCNMGISIEYIKFGDGCTFSRKELCGREFTVRSIYSADGLDFYRSDEGVENLISHEQTAIYYKIPEYVLEHTNNRRSHVDILYSSDEILDLLRGDQN